MDADTYVRVHQIATEVRKWCEEKNYKEQNFSRCLAGMCAIAAAELHTRLQAANIPSMIALHNGVWGCHCFVVVGNHIVDVTATQFGEKPVVIEEKDTAADKLDWWKVHRKYKTVKGLKIMQTRTGWVRSQRVS